MAKRFDHILVVDWSARSAPSPRRPVKDAIFIAHATGRAAPIVTYHRTRAEAMAAIAECFDLALAQGARVLAAFDFSFAYPAGFARHLTGQDGALALWPYLAARIEDDARNGNNRFDVARAINREFPDVGPFWCVPQAQACPDLPAKDLRTFRGLPERRAVEMRNLRMQPGWKLYTTGSVGSQALLGIARLQALRARYGAALGVAPFEGMARPIVLAECWPSLLAQEIAQRQGSGEILDAAQTRVMATALAHLPPAQLEACLAEGCPIEGGILGLGHEAALAAALGRADAP